MKTSLSKILFLAPWLAFAGCGKQTQYSKLPPRHMMISFSWQAFDFGLKDKSDFVKISAIQALGRIGNRTAVEAIASVDNGGKAPVVKACVSTLSQLHDSAAFQAVLGYSKSPDFNVRAQVAVGLSKMHDLYTDTMVVRLLKKMFAEVDSIKGDTLLYDREEIAQEKFELRSKIGIALMKVGDQSGLANFEHPPKPFSLQTKISLINVISEINPPQAVKLLSHFYRDRSDYVRAKVVESLGKIGSKEALADVKTFLTKDDADEVRANAAIALMKSDEAVAVPELLKSLDNPDDDRRSKVILALGDVRSDAAREKVLPVLRELIKDNSEWTRISAIGALGNLKDYESAPMMEQALGDKSQEVREIALGVLSRFKGKLMLETLKKYTKDDQYSMRSVALAGLGSIEDPSLQNEVILPILFERLKNDDELIVRMRAAFTILDILSDRKFTKKNS
jgi:HEAT repeat protein